MQIGIINESMIIKIRQEVQRTESLSKDYIYGILEFYLPNKYKLVKVSDSVFRFRKQYNSLSNRWEPILYSLSVDDNVQIKIKENSVEFHIDLTKQLVAIVIASSFLLFMLWRLYYVDFLVSMILVLILVLIFWMTIVFISKWSLKSLIQILKSHL